MKLTEKNFCPNIKDVSDNMRTAYFCKITKKICPKVSYSSGEPLPSKQFLEHSCSLLNKDEADLQTNIKEEKEKDRVQEKEVKVVEEVKEKVNKTQPKKTGTGQKRTTKKRNYNKKK